MVPVSEWEETDGTDQKGERRWRRRRWPPCLYLATCLYCEICTLHSSQRRRRPSRASSRQTKHCCSHVPIGRFWGCELWPGDWWKMSALADWSKTQWVALTLTTAYMKTSLVRCCRSEWHSRSQCAWMVKDVTWFLMLICGQRFKYKR